MKDKHRVVKRCRTTQLKNKAESLTDYEATEFKDLSPEDKEVLKKIRQVLAMDLLGIANAEIEKIFGWKRDFIYGIRANHSVLWSMGESDFIRRMRDQLDAVNESIAELINGGECEMLWRLRHMAQGANRNTRVPGHPSMSLKRVKGAVSPTVIVSAATAFLRHVGVIHQRIVSVIGAETAEELGLGPMADEFSMKIHGAANAEKNRRVVAKARRQGLSDDANKKEAQRAAVDKDLLPIQ